jgi:hypothetical protein
MLQQLQKCSKGGKKKKEKKMSGRRQPGKGKGHNFSKRLGKKGKKNQLNLWRASLQAAKSEKTAAAQEKARTKAAVHAAAAALAASVLSRGESNVQELLAYEPTNEGQHIRRTTLLAFYTDMKIYPLKAESTRLEAVAGAHQEAWQQVCVCAFFEKTRKRTTAVLTFWRPPAYSLPLCPLPWLPFSTLKSESSPAAW